MSMTEEALALLLRQAHSPVEAVEGTDKPVVAVLNNDGGYALEDLEKYLDAPRRIAQSVRLSAPQAFIAYVKKFGDPRRSVVFVNQQTFTGKLDYHAVHAVNGDVTLETPSWCSHNVVYAPVETNAWKAWKVAHNKQLGQVEFALFIEQRLEDITVPTAAELMTSVLEFKESSNHQLASQHDLSNGAVSFQFVKGNTAMNPTFPKELTLVLAIYENHAPITLKLNVRYRTGEGGSLKMWVAFQRDPVDIVEAYFKANAVLPIREALKDFQMYEGAAL